MRWIRLILAIVFSRFRNKIKFTQTTKIPFRVWISDIDVSIMNHAAFLTVFEVGRIDFMVRSGFFKLTTKKKWYAPAQGLTVQYYRPLKTFQKAQVFTRITYYDDKWIYMEQKIVRNGKDIAACLVKGTVKDGRERVAPKVVLDLLGSANFQPEKCDLIKSYELESADLEKRVKEWNVED